MELNLLSLLSLLKRVYKGLMRRFMCFNIWACCFPWAKTVIGEDGLVAQVWCKISNNIKGKPKLFTPKFNTFQKHVRHRKATIQFGMVPHLDKIKVALCVGHKIKGGVVVVGLLDSQQLDVQTSYFRLTMGHNVEVVMQEPSNVNLVIQMWLMIQSSPFLVLKLSEYIKVVEITMM